MAEIVAPLMEKLSSELWKELALLRGVGKDMRKLQSTLSTIKDVLHVAEQRSNNDRSLRNWLKKLKDVAYDADDVVDEFQIEALRRRMGSQDCLKGQVCAFFSSHNQLAFSHRIGNRLKDILERLGEIVVERNYLLPEGIVPRGLREAESGTHEEQQTYSAVIESEVFGRNDEKDKVVNFLVNEDNDKTVSVLPIVGIGGIGKTTLAQLVYNDERIKSKFDLQIWVCVSTEFDATGITRKILECIHKQSYNHLQLEPLSEKLRETLGGKRFFLVLDDVWNEDGVKWEKLKTLLTSGKEGSKIVVTTRSESVARVMSSISPNKLNVLSGDDCWNLFRERAFGPGKEEETPNLIEIGKEIVNKCGGLPLAIKVLGSLMGSKRGEAEWQIIRNSEIWRIEDDEIRILASLRLSYYHLPHHLKPCFAYFSLFPKDYEFKGEELIRLWIGEGFIPSSNGPMQMEDTGKNYLNNLALRLFIQDVTRDDYWNIITCKMHDLMHDLACDVAKDEFSSMTICQEIKPPNNCRYLSLFTVGEVFQGILNLSCETEKLRSLILQVKYHENIDINWNKLLRIRNLRVLELQGTNLTKVPSTICRLRHLRYLDLSRSRFKILPVTISGLYNLSVLIIKYCYKLEELPSSIGSLHNLRILDLSGCQNLLRLPSTTSLLTNLYTLGLSWCDRLEELPSTIGSLHNLRILDLSECHNLLRLPNTTSLLTNLYTLDLSRCNRLVELPGEMSNMKNLRHLRIDGCEELTNMPAGLGQLSHLQTLPFFIVCETDGHYISELQHLNQIRGRLEIRGLQKVKNAREVKDANLRAKIHVKELGLYLGGNRREPENAEEDVIGSLGQLGLPPDLKVLELGGYGGIRLPSWITESICVGNLREIQLVDLERCECLPPLGQLPSLKVLRIGGVPRIRRIGEEFYGLTEGETGGTFPSLEQLTLSDLRNLEEWVAEAEAEAEAGELRTERESMKFPSLRRLEIRNCPKLTRVQPGLPLMVEDLQVRDSNEELLSASSLARLSRVTQLAIRSSEASSSSPSCWEALKYLTTLEKLEIDNCEALTALPEVLGSLTSLQHLLLIECPNLEMLPDWLQRLTELRHLEIRYCPLLWRRCNRETGEDSHKIAHIRQITLSYTCSESEAAEDQLQQEGEQSEVLEAAEDQQQQEGQQQQETRRSNRRRRRRRGFKGISDCINWTGGRGRGLPSCLRGHPTLTSG